MITICDLYVNVQKEKEQTILTQCGCDRVTESMT